jgi:hypothetical protein
MGLGTGANQILSRKTLTMSHRFAQFTSLMGVPKTDSEPKIPFEIDVCSFQFHHSYDLWAQS